MQVDKDGCGALIFTGDGLRKLLPHYHPHHLPSNSDTPWPAPQKPNEREKRPQQLTAAPPTGKSSNAEQEAAMNGYCQALQMQEYQNAMNRALRTRIEAEQQAAKLANQAREALEEATKLAQDKQMALAQQMAEQTERQQELSKQAMAEAIKAQQQAAAEARAADLKAAQEKAHKLAMEQLAARAAEENQKGWERRQLVLQENHKAWTLMAVEIVHSLEQHHRETKTECALAELEPCHAPLE